MSNKQNSIEWLINCITEDQMVKSKSLYKWLKVFEQAKEMHKQEIEKAWLNGYITIDAKNAETYYNETFKNK
jgi:NADPH-dependent 7-cyano-7-deazaguanine reductase QueF